MKKCRISRKIWKKVVRAIILAGMTGTLGTTQAYGAEFETSSFTDAVEHALVDGSEGVVLRSPEFYNQSDVYTLMEQTCKQVDTPEIFLNNQCYVTYRMVTRGGGSGYQLSAEIERYEKNNDLDAKSIVDELQLKGHSDLEIAIIVHDWLTNSLEYGPSEDSLSECLEYGHGKCDDYSMIYASVMNEAGVRTRCMDGVPNGSTSGHMWNMVCIGGEWYLCDVTNDDQEGTYAHFLKSLKSVGVRNYLGNYLDGYRLCNGIDEFYSYRIAKKNYPVRRIRKAIAKLEDL